MFPPWFGGVYDDYDLSLKRDFLIGVVYSFRVKKMRRLFFPGE